MTNPTRLTRHLRRNITDVERHLWRRLRDRQIKGFKFRRQHPFREYVLDFVCLEAKLVIELDDSQHFDAQSPDAVKTSKLVAAGFQVLRFWNNEVLSNIEGVLEVVWRALPEEIQPPPSLPSPLQGEGDEALEEKSSIAIPQGDSVTPSSLQGEGENSVQVASNLTQLDTATPSPYKGEGWDGGDQK